MKIKIQLSNKAKVETLLNEINGKAAQHCYNHYEEIKQVADRFSHQLNKLLNKKDQVGSKFASTSGDSVPNAYKYNRRATSIILEKTSTGIFLTDAQPVTIYKEGGKESLIINNKQQDLMLAKLLKDNHIFTTQSE